MMDTNSDRKQYTEPEIIFETDLETRAGSTLGFPDFMDSDDFDF